MKPEIPTEFHVGFLDRTFEIHWNYHAWLIVRLLVHSRGHSG